MKKLIALVLTLACVLVLIGCSSAKEEGLLLKTENVKNVFMSSSPEGYAYLFSGDDANAVVDYFANLHITPYTKVIDETGMSWVISIEYENGQTKTVYYLCGKYIKGDDDSFYKIICNEASHFDTLLDELSK